MIRVIAFGAFDPLNDGQVDFLRQAKDLGDHLIVVVAHDSAIRANKHREPRFSEEERLTAVKALPYVDEVILGRKNADRYHVLSEVEFDIVAMGYNQKPDDAEVVAALKAMGKYEAKLIRLQPYKPELYPAD